MQILSSIFMLMSAALLSAAIVYGDKLNLPVVKDYAITQGQAIKALLGNGKTEVYQCYPVKVKPLANTNKFY